MDRQQIIKQIVPALVAAPSAHNTQPWQFAVSDHTIDIYADWSRYLRVSDPVGRQLYIGLGCALFNGIVMAAAHNYTVHTTYFPLGEGRSKPAARLALVRGSSNNHFIYLAATLPGRRTNRAIYDGKALTDGEKASLRSISRPEVNFIEKRQIVERIAAITGQGTFQSLVRPEFKRELSHWVRNNWTKKPDGMPGYALHLPAPLSLFAPLLVRIAPIHRQQQTDTSNLMRSASALVVISTPGDHPADWLRAGEVLEQIWLEATAANLAASPLVAAIEAGPSFRSQLRHLVAPKKFPQTIIRLGHSTVASRPTPRRAVSACLRPPGTS